MSSNACLSNFYQITETHGAVRSHSPILSLSIHELRLLMCMSSIPIKATLPTWATSEQNKKQDKVHNAWNQGCTSNACICNHLVVIIWTYLRKGFLLFMFCLSVLSWSEQPCDPCNSFLDNPDDHICRKMTDIWIKDLMVGDWECHYDTVVYVKVLI